MDRALLKMRLSQDLPEVKVDLPPGVIPFIDIQTPPETRKAGSLTGLL
jgi:hypothetical protein